MNPEPEARAAPFKTDRPAGLIAALVLAERRVGRWWSAHRRAGLVLVYAIVMILLAIPVLTSTVLLGLDDVNHLARIYIRAHIDTDPDLARIYRVRTDLVPYLGMDVLLTPLARVLPIMVVGRLFILLLVWGLIAAVAVLRYAFTGRIGLAPAAGGVIAYNGMLVVGLINYELGLLLALVVFAGWHACRERPWLPRLALFGAASTLLYLTHLLALVLYGILVVSYDMVRSRRPWRLPWHDWLVLAGQAVPAIVLWETLHLRVPSDFYVMRYDIAAKLVALIGPFMFRGAGGGPDTGLLALGFCCVMLPVGLRLGWLTCPRNLAVPALVLIGLTLVLPWAISLPDERLLLAAACLLLAGLRFTPAARHLVLPCACVMVLLTALHVTDVALLMHRCDGEYAELRQAFAALPRGAELTTVRDDDIPTAGVACTRLPIYFHMAQLIVIDRSGFAPDFFSRMQSVAVLGGRTADRDPIEAKQFVKAPASGYLLWLHLGHAYTAPAGLVRIWSGSFFDLWAVKSG